MQPFATRSQNYFLRFIFVIAASAAASEIGFLLLPSGGSATLIWPPSAIGIAVLFLYGYDLWPAITLSIFGIFLARNGNIPLDLSIAIADTIEAFVGAYFLRTYVELNPLLARLRDSMGLLVGCIAPTFLAAVIIAGASYLLGRVSITDLETTFVAIWIGHAVSALSFTPFLIRWLYRPVFTKTKDELVEGALIFIGVGAFSYFTFWTSYSMLGPVSLIYIVLILLIWAAMRTGPRGTTLGLALFSAIAAGGVLFGHGATATSHNQQVNLGVQVLLGVLDILFLLFMSTVEERKEAVVNLQANVGQLENAIEKIKSEDQAKTNFLAILAHELRNPLAPIVTSVELIKSDPHTKIDPELVETIEVHARTMSLLLDDLLDISRITQQRFELHREQVLMRRAIMRSVESVQSFLNSRKHSLTITLPKEDIFLDVDPVRFEQMLVNLLNNAGKYTDPGGHITLTCTREGSMALIRVADNGIGIAPDKLQGVFEPFGQRGAVLRLPGGLGVGLSLTKQLVELHGGSIEAHSRGLGMGSTFSLRVPLSIGPTVSPAAAARSFVNRLRNLQIGPYARSILLVDDNVPAAKGLAALLTRSGHTVTLAHSGEEALKKISELSPAVVILDIGLPDMSGYEVAAQVRASPFKPERLIALTGYGQDDDRAKSAEAGFDAHLTKPVSLADVEAVL